MVVEADQLMLHSKVNLLLFLWVVATNTAVHVINKTAPTRQGNKMPYDLWYGKPSSFKNFKVFGTECWHRFL
jgi:hypothetical protein